VAQISIANAPKLYRAILDGIEYRGTSFLQCFTTCQPEHGVADDMALTQAQRVRDSRGAPEFVFNPRMGETYQEVLDLKGNPSIDMDWYETKFKAANEPYRYTVAHWCATEARFRNHLKKIKKDDAAALVPLENMLVRITQQDVVYRRYLRPDHRSYVPDFGVYIRVQGSNGVAEYRSLSRQLVLFCVERRKAWRMLQSKAGTRRSARFWQTWTPARLPSRNSSRAPKNSSRSGCPSPRQATSPPSPGQPPPHRRRPRRPHQRPRMPTALPPGPDERRA
jgi:pyruvate-ferredoxin/flavodoxin oxidoreductase